MYEVWDQSVCVGVFKDAPGGLLYQVWGLKLWVTRRGLISWFWVA